jgi:hypothetical protein
MALCRGHDGIMSSNMVDQDTEHAINRRFSYLPQEIFIDHDKILG